MAASNEYIIVLDESNDHDKFQDKGCTPQANKGGNEHMIWASLNFRLGFFTKSKILMKTFRASEEAPKVFQQFGLW